MYDLNGLHCQDLEYSVPASWLIQESFWEGKNILVAAFKSRENFDSSPQGEKLFLLSIDSQRR